MILFNPMNWDSLLSEYGVWSKRLTPWEGVTPPFGGAWVVVTGDTTSLDHSNEPADEEELFICLTGRAIARVGDRSIEITPGDTVYLPPGKRHYIENPHTEDCHLYCLWWNNQSIDQCLASRRRNT